MMWQYSVLTICVIITINKNHNLKFIHERIKNMKKIILGIIMIFTMVSMAGCASSEVETETVVNESEVEAEETVVEETVVEELLIEETVLEETILEENVIEVPVTETEIEQEISDVDTENVSATDTYTDSITIKGWSEDNTEAYTLYFDGSRLNYLGNVFELWGEGNGELFGPDASDHEKNILGRYIDEWEWDSFLGEMESYSKKVILEEVRGDATMYVYEGYSPWTEKTFWEIVFAANSDVKGKVYFNYFTDIELTALEMKDIYELVTCFGEVKVSK